MEWRKIELRPLFDLLVEKSEEWEHEKVLSRTENLGKIVKPQLEEYTDGKYRRDRNEASGFFEAIVEFKDSGLPLSLDHFESLVEDYKERISPYPHYSGIKVVVPEDLHGLDKVTIEDVPDKAELEEESEEDSSMKLL